MASAYISYMLEIFLTTALSYLKKLNIAAKFLCWTFKLVLIFVHIYLLLKLMSKTTIRGYKSNTTDKLEGWMIMVLHTK